MREQLWKVFGPLMGFSMVVRRGEMGVAIDDVDFNNIEFWVQIHNLLVELLTKRNAELIGKQIGKIKKVEDPLLSGGVARNYLRVRVEVRVDMALIPGF